jgi:hypothetical protein
MPAPEGILQAELRKFMQGIVKTKGRGFDARGCERGHYLAPPSDLGTRTSVFQTDMNSHSYAYRFNFQKADLA